jgi:hypothetical protein
LLWFLNYKFLFSPLTGLFLLNYFSENLDLFLILNG